MTLSFHATILSRFEARFYLCPSCGFLRSEAPHWLEEAYSSAIGVTDTGLVARNLKLARQTASLIFTTLDPRAKYVDVSGGHGLLVRLMRDCGFDFYWEDPYCENTHARGFEASKVDSPFAACTAFEVMEHLHEPLDFIQTQLRKYSCRTYIFSTELYAGPSPPAQDWWYYSFPSGQHISFYSRATLERMAKALNLRFYSCSGVHIFTGERIHWTFARRVLMKNSVSALFSPYIQLRLKSRTLADHQYLSELKAQSLANSNPVRKIGRPD